MLIEAANNQLTFSDGRYYKTDGGGYVPSVTTILEAYPKPYALMQWLKDMGENADKIKEAAGERGSLVHKLTEQYDEGLEVNLLDEWGNPQYSLEAWKMFERYVDFSETMQPNILLSETNFIGNKYAGTVDRVVEIGGKIILVDIKTSNIIANSYWLQLAAYKSLAEVYTNYKIDEVAILWLNAKTRISKDNQGVGWQLIRKEDTSKDKELFDAVFKLWMHEHSEEKPKFFTYQIKYAKGLPNNHKGYRNR